MLGGGGVPGKKASVFRGKAKGEKVPWDVATCVQKTTKIREKEGEREGGVAPFMK